MEECIFDYMASRIECRFNKNSLLQCYSLATLPAGIYVAIISTFNYFSRKVFVTSGLGGMSGAQPKAGVICGCIAVVAEVCRIIQQNSDISKPPRE